MTLLLNWRIWVALALAGLLAFSHLTVYRKGLHDEHAKWDAAVATANAEARRLEQARQRRADEAAALAAERESRIRADADGARKSADSLRDAAGAALQYASESRAAAERVADTATGLLGRCAAEYVRMGEAAARADSEARQLRQAWPRN